ncbi:hypothetical protein ACHWQZ_G017508 [Mnemiopsis leidyi]
MKQPGVVTVINEQFFESETRKLFDDLEKDILEMEDGTVKGKDGRLSWKLTRVGVYEFDGPTTDVEISSNNDQAVFTLEMEDASIKTTFHWAASYDLWLTDIKISGQATAKLYEVDMTKSVALGISDSGRLELDSRDCHLDSCCSMEIGEMDISVYGGAVAWIIDKTIGWWESEIKDMIKREACSRIDDVIHSELNSALNAFPTTTNIVHEELHFNYTLLHLDVVGECLVVGIDGGVTPAPGEETDNLLCNATQSQGLLGVGGHTPLPASDCVSESYDFRTRISHSSIQSLVESVFHAGLLGSFSLDEETIQRMKVFQPGYFSRSEDELLQHYLINAEVNITRPPSASINTELRCIDMEIPTELKLEMLHPNMSKEKKLLLVLNTTFTVGVQFQVAKDVAVDEEGRETSSIKLQGKMIRVQTAVHNTTKNPDYEVEVKPSSVGTLINLIRAQLLQPRVYKHLENGIPTNFGDVFEVEVPNIKYFENYVEFEGIIEDWAVNM